MIEKNVEYYKKCFAIFYGLTIVDLRYILETWHRFNYDN